MRAAVDAPPPDRLADARQTLDAIGRDAWDDAQSVAVLLAVDPYGLNGIAVRAAAGPVRDLWTKQFLALLPDKPPVRRLPLTASEDRLLGGLDLAATLAAGRPVAEKGVLADVNDGVLIAAMGERMPAMAAAHVAAALDDGFVRLERDGLSRLDRARFAVLLFDESVEDHESPSALLLERLAFRIDLHAVSARAAHAFSWDAGQIEQARERLSHIVVPDEILSAMNMAALSVGAASIRVLKFCHDAARASAALAGRDETVDADAEIACRLVLGPRAIAPPHEETAEEAPSPDTESREETSPAGREEATENSSENDHDRTESDMPDEMMIEALAGAALANPLNRLQASKAGNGRNSAAGKSGQLHKSRQKGRPIASRKGDPRRDGRLDILATLRAASPWQKLRADDGVKPDAQNARIRIRTEDFQVRQFKQQSESTVIFVVDASGSSAMNRMAEAKGAVERLLADCYARRDYVALIAFRGKTAELILPPTRSLVRARRQLAQLPGGGGTPLAAGIDAAFVLASAEKARGRTPYVVILSDGRGNIARNGEPGREAAETDALSAARRLGGDSGVVLFFDTSPRPNKRAQALSAAMGAQYQLLPFVDGGVVSKAVRRRMTQGGG